MFSLGGCFPPSSLAIDEASYSALSTTSLPARLQEYNLLFCAISGNFGYWSQGRICWGEHYISRPFRAGIRFGLSRFRSPLLAGSQLISLPAGTQMFPSPAFAFLSERRDALRQSRQVIPHSEIPGSKAACSSPGLIAACHVLLRHPSQVIHHTASLHTDE